MIQQLKFSPEEKKKNRDEKNSTGKTKTSQVEELIRASRAKVYGTRFPGPLQVIASIYKLNLPSKALNVLIFASLSLQV